MRDFLKRHKLVALAIKSIVFLALLGVLGTAVVTSYISSKATSIAALDRNSVSAASASLQANVPVFIEICRPVCALQLPEVEKVAEQLKGQVVFYQLDPEGQPEILSSLFDLLGQPITTYPAHLILTKNSKVVSGLKTSAQLLDFISQATGVQASKPSGDASAQSGNTGTPAQPTVTYKNITVVTEANFEQELTGVTTPVYLFLCSGHECEIQADALDTVAGRYAGKIKFIQVDWYDNPNITVSLVRSLQVPLSFPIHIVISPKGAILNYAAEVMQDAGIEKFISDALANEAAMNASTGSNSTVVPAATQTVQPVASATAIPSTATPSISVPAATSAAH